MDPVSWYRGSTRTEPGHQSPHGAAPSLGSLAVGLILLVLWGLLPPLAHASGGWRTVEGRDVRFDIPAGADRSRFAPVGDGRWRYVTATRVKGLGRLSVTVGPRGDPEALLQMELQGWQASARMPAFRKEDVRCMDMNRGVGVVGLQRRSDGVQVAHASCWSHQRHFELALESGSGGTDPLNHPVFKKLVGSFRSKEAPLRHPKSQGEKP